MQVNLSSQGGFCTPSRTLESDRLSASAPPLTFAHLSDLHIHRFRPQHRRLYEAINERGVDFIFLTGDTLHHSPSGVRAAGRFLRGLRARRAVCACPGNGEARTFGRRSDFVELMGRWGVRALANRQVSFVTPAGPVTVAGLDDLIEGQPHVEAALPPRGGADFTVLLAHEPLAARLVPPERRPDLVLSGHTHGGHVALRDDRHPRGGLGVGDLAFR